MISRQSRAFHHCWTTSSRTLIKCTACKSSAGFGSCVFPGRII